MVIKIIDLDEFMDRNSLWAPDSYFQSPYEVLAIMRYRRKKRYLVEHGNRLTWWDADLFEIIDEAIPRDWISICYKKFHRYKNKNYYFNIPINYYHGPKTFLDNPDFFFDILDEPADAYRFYCNHLKKNVITEKFDKSNTDDLKIFLFNSCIQDAKLEGVSYESGEGCLKIRIYNPIFSTKLELTFCEVGSVLAIRGNEFENREKIISLTVEEDYSYLKNWLPDCDEKNKDSIYLMFQMFSGDELHIVSRNVVFEIVE